MSKNLYGKFLKNSKTMNESRRKLNENSSSIEMSDSDYYECLWALFDSAGEKEDDKYVEWYSDIGIEVGIAPNKMYAYVKYEATLATVEEILSDVFEKSLDDFSDEKEAVQYVIDNFDGSMDYRDIDGETLFLYVP